MYTDHMFSNTANVQPLSSRTSTKNTGSSGSFTKSSSATHPILSLTAQWATELPSPVLLQLHVPGAPAAVQIWTGTLDLAQRSQWPSLAEAIVFDGAELVALAAAAAEDRLWHADLLVLCFEKWRQPETVVNAARALADVNPSRDRDWTLARVFARIQVQLEAVDFDAYCTNIGSALHAAA